MQMCINYGQFKKIMLKKGYIINDDYNRKYPTIRSINDKQEVRKMERYSNEIRLVVTQKLKTTEDVKSYITQTENDIEDITNLRQKYRNKLRNCTDDKLIQEYKEKRNECTTILNKYRKNLKTANYILEDIPKVKEVIKIERKMKRLKKLDITKVKQKNKNLIR